MRVLITGVNSAIGNSLAEALFQNGDEVIGTDKEGNSKARYEIIEFDLIENTTPRFPKIDACIHMASLTNAADTKSLFTLNVYGTYRVLEIAKNNGATKLLYVSTGGVYGFKESASKESIKPHPFDAYSLTKLLGELLCRHYVPDLQVTILRYFFPYGPLTNKDRLINRLVHRINNGLAIQLNHDNKPVINPIYISDLIQATLLAFKKTTANLDIFNVAGKERINIFQLASMLSSMLGKNAVYDNTRLRYKNMIGDTQKIERQLGFKPAVSLEQGLRLTVDWYKREIGNSCHDAASNHLYCSPSSGQ